MLTHSRTLQFILGQSVGEFGNKKQQMHVAFSTVLNIICFVDKSEVSAINCVCCIVYECVGING